MVLDRRDIFSISSSGYFLYFIVGIFSLFLVHGSGTYSLALHRNILGLIPVWSACGVWAFLSPDTSVFLVSVFAPILPIHIFLYTIDAT